ncbi:MAG: N-methylhydantoinase A [Dinoroseobacter sp.]
MVPPGAGVGSAIGFLRAPFSFEATRSVYMKLSAFAPDTIKTLLGELQTDATSFVRTCDAEAAIECIFKVYMRYSGQGWEIPVDLSQAQAMAPDAAEFERLFEAEYIKLFGRTVAGMDIEITVWSVNATTPSEVVARVALAIDGQAAPIAAERQIFDPALSQFTNAAVVIREAMQPGAHVEGPAAITEDETTIIIPSSRRAIRQPDGCIDITLKAQGVRT